MGRRRALLIQNPNSRRGADRLNAVIDQLHECGLTVVAKIAANPKEAGELIANFSSQIECVILAGGDGTLHSASGALMKAGLPFGILPLGTANDLARTLQIPADLEEACRIIAAGRIHPIDLGCVNGIYFFNAAHLGLAVRVTKRLSREKKSRWGALSYGVALANAMRERRPFTAVIRWDQNVERVRSIQITISNGRHYGGGMTASEDAAIDDHALDLYTVKPLKLMALLRLALTLRAGPDAESPGLCLFRARRFEVETAVPMKIQTDGEMSTTTPARFEVIPNALRVFVPEEYQSPKEMV